MEKEKKYGLKNFNKLNLKEEEEDEKMSKTWIPTYLTISKTKMNKINRTSKTEQMAKKKEKKH